QAWRAYRRMMRRGRPEEVDVQATVERCYQDGVFLGPALVAPRVNHARLLILEDVGGSMAPFEYITRVVIESAQHAGLAEIAVRYFHDVPVNVVFRERGLAEPEALGDALAPFTDDAVLVYSDGGAARGGADVSRTRRTLDMLEQL